MQSRDTQSLVSNPTDWTDLELLEHVLAANERGWAELVRRYRALIYRCITKVTQRCAPRISSVDVDEIFADVLLNLLRDDMRKLRLYDPARGTKLSSWIGMISINSAYDYLRSAGRRPLLDRLDGAVDPVDGVERTPLDVLIEKERWAHLNGVLTGFSERDRTFVELYYRDGLDPASIAAAMSISLKTVYSKKHKIRAHLRKVVSACRDENPIADLVAPPAVAMAA
jgi:RNA polymerase sigma-70 factor (ECF subfamily)